MFGSVGMETSSSNRSVNESARHSKQSFLGSYSPLCSTLVECFRHCVRRKDKQKKSSVYGLNDKIGARSDCERKIMERPRVPREFSK